MLIRLRRLINLHLIYETLQIFNCRSDIQLPYKTTMGKISANLKRQSGTSILTGKVRKQGDSPATRIYAKAVVRLPSGRRFEYLCLIQYVYMLTGTHYLCLENYDAKRLAVFLFCCFFVSVMNVNVNVFWVNEFINLSEYET